MGEDVKKIVEDLNCCFMRLDEYQNEVQSGRVIDLKWYDNGFEYLNHPLNSENKAKRIHASDQLRDHINLIDENILTYIHKHVFDCCAAVRLSLVEALMYRGNKTSIPFLEELTIMENESDSVRNMTNIVLDVMKNDLGFMKVDIFLFVGKIIDDQANGLGKMFYAHSGDLIYEGRFQNNKFDGLGTYFNDDGTIRYKGIFKQGKLVESV